jgi:hypothetical protein
MAYFAPVNGDAQPVFALDTRNGPIAATSTVVGQPVQPQGPKLDFYRVVANVSLADQQGVQEYVANVIQAVQQTSTVAMYQLDTVGGVGAISFAIYPTGAFGDSAANPPTTTSTAKFLLAANVAATGIQLDTCQSLGFKLAAS